MDTPKLIPKDQLEHGYYIGRHRNTNLAYWDHREEVFVYIKWEMWGPVIDTAKHPEDDDKFALFYPVEKVNTELGKYFRQVKEGD